MSTSDEVVRRLTAQLAAVPKLTAAERSALHAACDEVNGAVEAYVSRDGLAHNYGHTERAKLLLSFANDAVRAGIATGAVWVFTTRVPCTAELRVLA